MLSNTRECNVLKFLLQSSPLYISLVVGLYIFTLIYSKAMTRTKFF